MFNLMPKTGLVTFKNTSSLSTNFAGTKIKDVKDIIYGQVLINPNIIDFGQITAEDSQNVELWNASSSGVNLLNIDKIGFDGLELVGDETGYISAGSSKIYKFVVSSEGGKTLNAKAEYVFDNADNASVSIFGSRIVIFGFLPNYGSENVLNYSYRTEIQTFYAGNEERHPIYVNSEMMISNNYLFNGVEALKVKNILQNFGSDEFLVPAYQNYTTLLFDLNIGENEAFVDKTEIFEIGQNVMIGTYGLDNSQAEIIDIDSSINKIVFSSPISKNYKAKEKLSCIYNALFQDNGNSINKITGDVFDCSLAIKVLDMKENLKAYDSIVINQFDNLDILEVKPDSRNTNQSFDFVFEDFKSFGKMERIQQMIKADNIFSYGYKSEKEEIEYIKKFFHNQKGRLKEFLVPSFFKDMIVSKDINPESNSITIKNAGYSSFNANAEKREYLVIRLRDGRSIYKKIFGFNAFDGEDEIVIIDTPLGEFVKKEDVMNIEFVYKSRFNSDTLSLSYYNYDFAEINLSFKSL